MSSKQNPAIKYTLCNQDVDTSLITLEMTWSVVNAKKLQNKIGIAFLEIINGKTINFYIEADKFKPYVDACANVLLNNKTLLKSIKNKTIQSALQIRKLATDNIGKVHSLNRKDIITLIKKTKKLQSRCTQIGTIVAFADIFGGITNSLTEILNKRRHLKHPLNTYMSVFGNPREKSLTEKAYEKIINSNIDDSLLLHEYFWLDQGYVGRGLTPRHLRQIRKNKQDERKHPPKRELEKELNLSQKEKRIFEVSRSLIFIKSLRADSRQYLHVVMNQIIDELAKKTKINPKYLEALHAEELCEIVNGKPLPKDIKKRWAHGIIIANPDQYQILAGKKAGAFLKNKLIKDEIQDQESIKGQIAQTGKIQGKVKLIFGPQHNNKVKNGEILISTATSPQLLPAMKRAAAFVTDIGGITSHAAIVAREMNKPCVVGTKYATQIFHDGDFVEVDAYTGVVKILKDNKTSHIQ